MAKQFKMLEIIDQVHTNISMLHELSECRTGDWNGLKSPSNF
jgi:hypothetical protein